MFGFCAIYPDGCPVREYPFDHNIVDPAHRSWFESPGGANHSPALHQNAFGFLAQVVYNMFIPV